MLWTRLVDDARAAEDLALSLEMAEDEAFSKIVSLDGEAKRGLLAKAEFDHCVKTRVTGLRPGTIYFYRFSYEHSDVRVTTRTGRTKTAPAEDADVSVRFAVISCQDYAGKYFHAHRHLATKELDLVVHLGDYVYETTGDPTFQVQNPARQVSFGKPEQALTLNQSGQTYQAAVSLDNYRDLYRLYRADRDLQALHERFAMIAIQDDHEFSDDCHGAIATYTDGREDETELDRRLAADRAWFEYMPVDLSLAPTEDWDGARPFPDQLRYYRNFVFGQHLELVLTDLRRYRPDHLVPEDAFPGAVFLEQTKLRELLGTLPAAAVPYVDIDRYARGAYRDALQAGADALEITSQSVQGQISVPYINDALKTLGVTEPPPIDASAADFERGYAYHQLLKSAQFSRIGSRYVVALEPFTALAQAAFNESAGQSERLMGDAQREWFLATLKASTRTFKVWGSEVCVMPRHIDLRPISAAPSALRQQIAITVEDWDGFPNERAALLSELATLNNVVIMSGDLHCFFAGTPYAAGDPQQRVVEFVTGSMTSATWQDGLNALASSNPSLPAETKFIASSVGTLLTDPIARPNPHLAWQNLAENGYAICEVNAERLSTTLYSLPSVAVATAPSSLSKDLNDLFREQAFEVPAGSADLIRLSGAKRERWDIASMDWVPVE